MAKSKTDDLTDAQRTLLTDLTEGAVIYLDVEAEKFLRDDDGRAPHPKTVQALRDAKLVSLRPGKRRRRVITTAAGRKAVEA